MKNKIRFQWVAYQLESIPSDDYIKSDSVTDTVSVKKTNSYWPYDLELCDLSPPIEELRSKYVRIDHYWRKVGGILKDDGTFKYAQLFLLVKLLLSISHGNSVPERGFSTNKYLLQVHGFSTSEKTIEALRFVKDEIYRVGGVMKFPTDRELLSYVKGAHGRCVADLEAERELREKEEREKNKAEKEKEENVGKNESLAKLEMELNKHQTNLKVVQESIKTVNQKLQKRCQKNPYPERKSKVHKLCLIWDWSENIN